MMYCNSFSRILDKNEDMYKYQVKKISVPYNGFETIIFKGMEFLIPSKTDEYLCAHYGKSFMIPNEHFDYKKEATNIFWYPIEERVAKLNLYSL